jgi:hypothetical protein
MDMAEVNPRVIDAFRAGVDRLGCTVNVCCC